MIKIKNNKTENYSALVAIFLFAILMLVVIAAVFTYVENEARRRRLELEENKFIIENVYFYAQRDALEGDVRVAKDSTGEYRWIKSCWEDNEELQDPSKPEIGRAKYED